MEEAQIAEQQFEKERIKAMADANQVFNCSGGQVHNHNCDGECGIRNLDPLEIEINDEMKKWQEAGMIPLGSLPQLGGHVPGVPVDVLKTSVAVAALTKVIATLGVSEEEIDNTFRQMYLDMVRDIREANEERVAAEQRRSGIEVVQQHNQILIPDHIARKMH